MKKTNYINLKSCYDAYEKAKVQCQVSPGNLSLHRAVSGRLNQLLDQILFILWDETPKGMERPMDPNELPF